MNKLSGLTVAQMYEKVGINPELQSQSERVWWEALFEEAKLLTGNAIDTLYGAHEDGPLFDGDLPSKVGRDILVDLKMMVRVVVKGENGFNACTEKGSWVYKLLKNS